MEAVQRGRYGSKNPSAGGICHSHDVVVRYGSFWGSDHGADRRDALFRYGHQRTAPCHARGIYVRDGRSDRQHDRTGGSGVCETRVYQTGDGSGCHSVCLSVEDRRQDDGVVIAHAGSGNLRRFAQRKGRCYHRYETAQ